MLTRYPYTTQARFRSRRSKLTLSRTVTHVVTRIVTHIVTHCRAVETRIPARGVNTLYVYHTGTFSEPEAILHLERRLAYYVYSYYLPVTLVVLLSWVSFWINPRSTPARVSLGVITILAMGNFLQNNKDTPQVSYATAMDVYVITCFVFVFLCLVEFAAVHCGLSDDDANRKSEMFEVRSKQTLSRTLSHALSHSYWPRSH